jgi:plastocyanin
MRTSASLIQILRLSAVVGASALVVAGCGSSSSSSSSQPAANATGTASSGGGSGTPIAVTLKNYSITLSQKPTTAGTYTFTVTNKGPSSHNLTINGPGVANQTTGTFTPSSTAKTLTVTLKNGAYDFYCSVPGHKQLGMNVEVMIGGGSSSGGSGAGSTGGSSSSGGSWS